MRYQFDKFTLDTDRFELSKSGVPLRTEPQVIELLALLVSHRDRMLSKDEINENIWRGRIVSDAALSSRIKSARQILGDTGQEQRFIRTIHGKGFRFVAEVKECPAEAAQPVEVERASAIAGESPDAVPSHAQEMAVARSKPAVAVLPFTNLSGDAGQEYFSDGVTTDIITHLSKHRWLDVTARNTSFGCKGKIINVQQLGRELNVDYVVEGSIQRAGDRIRVSANLVDARSGHHKWAERFDRRIDDIFSLQDEITEKIVARVEPEIGIAERNKVVQAQRPDLRAWDCYHLGIYHFFKFTEEDNRVAQRLLRLSQQQDPRFGEAYAWWAYALILGMVYWDTPPTQELLDEALGACDTAVALDGQNATFHALKARVLLARREYDRAIAENEIAISLNPTFAAAYCGLGDSLAYEGRYEESIGQFTKSIALSPNDPQLWAFLTYGALAALFKGDFEAALEWTERAYTIPNCQYWTTAHQMVALVCLGRVDEATRLAAKLMAEQPAFSVAFAREKLFYLKMPEQIEMYLNGLREAGVKEE